MNNEVFTIGHSNHKFSVFLELNQKHNVNMVVDVRTSPYSKYSSHFNKKPLKKALEDSKINYTYLGHKIGGKPKDKKFYHEYKLIYHLLEKDEKYQEGIDELLTLARDNQVVIMCSEEDPHRCHRHHLITPSLQKLGFIIIHIRGNGNSQTVESNYQARLI